MEGKFLPPLFSRPLRAKRLIEANAVGRSSKTVREFLEKNHKDDMNRVDTIKLTVKSLLEVVQTGAKNIEITVMESFGKQTVRARWRSAPVPSYF
jgi:20S proteasome alpha/beta subunit